MASTSFEDRLARLAAENPRAAQPEAVRAAPLKPMRAASLATNASDMPDAPETSGGPDVKRLGIYFLGGFFGLILSVILNVGMIAGSPWGPGSDIGDIVMLPTMALCVILIIALLPASLFYKRAAKTFAFLLSTCTMLFIGFFV